LNYGVIWKSDWFIGVLVSLLFLIGSSSQLSGFQSFDLSLYDFTSRSNTLPVDDRIVLIEINAKGSGQQPQSSVAAAIEKLSNGGAKLIALDTLYSEAELTAATATDATQQDLLANNVHLAGNVLLPLYFEFASGEKQSNIHAPNYIKRSAIRQINYNNGDAAASNTFMVRHPYNKLSEGAAGFGHFNLLTDKDEILRSLPLAIEFSGQYYPSMALALAAGAMNIPLSDVRINLGLDIELGAMNVATDPQLRILPAFHIDGSGNSYSSHTLSSLLAETTPADLFKGKIILIGTPEDSVATPLKTQMSRSEFAAHTLQSILNNESVIRPGWAIYAELALLLLAGLYLILLLPRLSPLIGVIATASISLILLISGYFIISALCLWIQTGLTTLLLITGQLGISLKQYLVIKEKQPTTATDPNETNKMLGLSFQSQGMLENAYAKFLTCPMNEDLLSILYDLALAFERKRQFDDAISVYEHMATHNNTFRDIQTRIISAKNARDSLTDKGSNAGISSLLASGDNKPTLGRYEIVSELGKGAMGTVYLGRDPKINRQVAIKTLALSKEFEPDQLNEVKERFFHEAEIAGMLNHPNIVTIFDAGDEHDLAYIAMEYLDGIDLIPYTKKGKTLPIPTTLRIIAKVAEALQYAHNNGVIHRDIKPANIMILKNKAVKVTDFGIAHITESSKSKAGTVLGTPSYMSPEQLSGKPIDGRSDLVSRGVMFYEMVAGARPFKAESIAKLMFKIAKEPHEDVRKKNPDVPDDVADLINSLLTKKADQRLSSAGEALERIQKCLQASRSQGGS